MAGHVVFVRHFDYSHPEWADWRAHTDQGTAAKAKTAAQQLDCTDHLYPVSMTSLNFFMLLLQLILSVIYLCLVYNTKMTFI